jgi:hypothetical protein
MLQEGVTANEYVPSRKAMSPLLFNNVGCAGFHFVEPLIDLPCFLPPFSLGIQAAEIQPDVPGRRTERKSLKIS